MKRKTLGNAPADLNLTDRLQIILLLSRDIETRMMIRTLRAPAHYFVIEAADEQHASVLCRKMRGKIDLIITDQPPSQIACWGQWHHGTPKLLLLSEPADEWFDMVTLSPHIEYLAQPFTAEKILFKLGSLVHSRTAENGSCGHFIHSYAGERRAQPLTSYENMILLNRFAPRYKKKVLIVDDDYSLRRMLAAQLKEAGFEVTEASNGREALSRGDTLEADVILTEIVMPEMEGMQLIRELLHRNPALKIIAMSGGHNANDYLTVARRLGAKATLLKPLHNEELMRTVSEISDCE